MSVPFDEQEVLELLRAADAVRVEVWIDGGWGVDALLGRQTRTHDDLDVVIERQHESAFVKMLRERGFAEVLRWYTTAVHTVWEDRDGLTVDLHVIQLSERGDGVFGDEGVYPAESLRVQGAIGGRQVRCIDAATQVQFHRGYEIRPQDRHDVRLLCDTFNLVPPPEYAEG